MQTVTISALNVAKDCNGAMSDYHEVTWNGSGSSSVTSPAFVLMYNAPDVPMYPRVEALWSAPR